MRGIFVTGTDTGIGKTVVSAALLRRYRDLPLHYWKPVQTGIEQDDDTAEAARLSGCGAGRTLAAGVRLPQPVSPHLAARRHGSVIQVDDLLEIARDSCSRGHWAIEGAGGVLVPLNDRSMQIDLIQKLGVPVLVVARSGLGTINHTLLTLEAVARRNIACAGVVMVGAPDVENRRAIERYGRTPVLGELPPLQPLTPSALGAWADACLDPEGRLREIVA